MGESTTKCVQLHILYLNLAARRSADADRLSKLNLCTRAKLPKREFPKFCSRYLSACDLKPTEVCVVLDDFGKTVP